jgi:hypothetical protein
MGQELRERHQSSMLPLLNQRRCHLWQGSCVSTGPRDGTPVYQSQDFRYGAIPTMSAEVHLYPRGLYQVVCTPILDGLHTSLLLVIQAAVALD